MDPNPKSGVTPKTTNDVIIIPPLDNQWLPSKKLSDLDKLNADLSGLPDDRGFKEFLDMPVDGFGAALLAGYGWYEGKGIGKNARQDVEVVRVKRNSGRHGLGFSAAVKLQEYNFEG